MEIKKAKHSQLDHINHFIRNTLIIDYPDEIISEYEFINDRLFWTVNLEDHNLYLLFDNGTLTGFYNYHYYNDKALEMDLFVGKFERADEYKDFLMRDFLERIGENLQIYSIIDKKEKKFFESYGFLQFKTFW